MAVGRSKKPCIGCGKLPEKWQDSWTADKPLCGDCCYAIKHYDGLARLLKRYTDKKSRKLAALRVPGGGRYYSLPYIRHDYERGHSSDCHFQPAFYALLMALSEECPNEGQQESLIKNTQDYGDLRVFDAAVVEPLRKLYEEATWLSNNAFKEGQRDGADLLKQLMSGEIKNEDINERVTKDQG